MQPASICFPLGYMFGTIQLSEKIESLNKQPSIQASSRSGCSIHKLLPRHSQSTLAQSGASNQPQGICGDKLRIKLSYMRCALLTDDVAMQLHCSIKNLFFLLSLCLFWLVAQPISNISGRSGPRRNCLAGKSTMISPRRSAH